MTTTKKAAAPAKKTAAAKTTTDTTKTDEATADSTTTDDGAQGNETVGISPTDYGPGTSNPKAPAEEDTAGTRPPASIVNSDPNAAPLDPPADAGGQRQPALGYQTSTTDQAYAESAGRTIAGENHLRLVDEAGNDLSADDLFKDENSNLTYVLTATRIFEEFTYPNTKRVSSRLMYTAGQRVPRFQAERIKKAVRDTAESDEAGVTSAESAGMGTLKTNVADPASNGK